MALVKLKHNWFAPSEPYKTVEMQNPISGRMYRRGVVEIPDEYINRLPKSAEILDNSKMEEADKQMREHVSGFDEGRIEALAEKAASDLEAGTIKAKSVTRKKRNA